MRRAAVAPAVPEGRDAVDRADNACTRKPFEQPVLTRYGQLDRITMQSGLHQTPPPTITGKGSISNGGDWFL